MTRKRTLCNYFGSKTTKTSTTKKAKPSNLDAQSLADRLDAEVSFLTPDGASWYILKRKWLVSTNDVFEKEWNVHPTRRHELKVYGKLVQERRWSQSWGISYAYSGALNVARPLDQSDMVSRLVQKANELVGSESCSYNGCLQNWYEPPDTIGLHSDDERSMRKDLPIFSLSWGGTRRFLFRDREDKNRKTELYLQDGDLLVMGGTCQGTHYHEIPKLRKTMDPPTSNRINWTIRAFLAQETNKK